MTPADVETVKTTFVQILPQADEFGPKFYERLFSLDPALKDMFKEDIAVQSKKLVRMLATLVAGLESLETVVPTLESLAVRHVGYGVRDEHYNIVGQSLIWTIDQQLGDAFTPQVRDAWVAAYVLISETMKAAARDATEHVTKGAAPGVIPAA
jgi:nitric oxide dioxygenase